MRATTDADAEAWVLTSDQGLALLAEASAVAAPRPADLTRWRRLATADQVAGAVRLAESRRRGAAKFTRADRMWFEPTGLEQATAEAVARHKAARFAGNGAAVVDLCCGIGGDTLALAESVGSGALAVDLDPGMLRRAAWNARAYGVGDRVLPVRARAQTFALPSGSWAHIDPDRRARGSRSSRARNVSDYQPGPEWLLNLSRTVPGGAIKLGPGSDFADHFGGTEFEVEVVSLNGECKEATVWFGGAATVTRRSTKLPQGVTWTDRDGPRGLAPIGAVSAWVFDPDPSLTRAGLFDGFATAHGLTRVASDIDLLTGRHSGVSPFLTPFEVIAVLPLDFKRLKREIVARRLGTLEIKTKGIDLRPEDVRARLKPEGEIPATLILIGGRGPGRAIIAQRVATR